MYSQSSLSLSQMDADDADGRTHTRNGSGTGGAGAADGDWPSASQSQSQSHSQSQSAAGLDDGESDAFLAQASVVEWHDDQAPEALVQQWEAQQRQRRLREQLRQLQQHAPAHSAAVPNSANWLTKGRHAHAAASSSSAMAASSAAASFSAGIAATAAAGAARPPSSNPFAVALRPSTSLTATPFSLVAAKMRAGSTTATGKAGARPAAAAAAPSGAPSSVQSKLVAHGGGTRGSGGGNSSGKKKGKGVHPRAAGAQGTAGAQASSGGGGGGSEESKSGGADGAEAPPAKRPRKASIMERFKNMVDQSQVQEHNSKLRSQRMATQFYSSPPFSDSAGSDSALAGLLGDASTPPTLYSTPPADFTALASSVNSTAAAGATMQPAQPAPTPAAAAAPLPLAAVAAVPLQAPAPPLPVAAATAPSNVALPVAAAFTSPLPHAASNSKTDSAPFARPAAPPPLAPVALAPAVPIPPVAAPSVIAAPATAQAGMHAPGAFPPRPYTPPAAAAPSNLPGRAGAFPSKPQPPVQPAVQSQWAKSVSASSSSSAASATSHAHPSTRPPVFKPAVPAVPAWGGGFLRPQPVAPAPAAARPVSSVVTGGAIHPAPPSAPANAAPAAASIAAPAASAFGLDDFDDDDDLLSMLDAVEKKHADFTMSQQARPAQPQAHAPLRPPLMPFVAQQTPARPQAHGQQQQQQQQQFRAPPPAQPPQSQSHFPQQSHAQSRMHTSGLQASLASSFKGGLPPQSHAQQPAQAAPQPRAPNAFSSTSTAHAAAPTAAQYAAANASASVPVPALPPSQHARSNSVSVARPASAAPVPAPGHAAASPPSLLRASTLPLPSSSSPPAPLIGELDLPANDPCRRLTVMEVVDVTARLPALLSQSGPQPASALRHVVILRCFSELEYASYNVLLKDEWLPANGWGAHAHAAEAREGEDVAGLRVRKNQHINVIGEFCTLDASSALAALGPTPAVQRAVSTPSPVPVAQGRAPGSLHPSLSSASSAALGADNVSSLVAASLSACGLGFLTSYPTCVVDSHSNLLVTHPHLLISGTRIAQSFPCIRRAWLSEKLQPSGVQSSSVVGGGGSAGVKGTMAHDLFERSVLHQRYDAATLRGHIAAIIAAHLDDIYGVRETEASMEAHLAGLIPPIQRWAATAFRNPIRTPPPLPSAMAAPHSPIPTSAHASSALTAPASPVFSAADKQPPKLHRVLDTEETIWSRHYGLKGKLDASVLAFALNEDIVRRYWSLVGGAAGAAAVPLSHFHHKSIPLPLELKTGRGHFSHRAQVMLYTLLMSEKCNKRIEFGLLLYLQGHDKGAGSGSASAAAKRSSPVPTAAGAAAPASSGSIQLELIHCKRNEIRELIIRRNELAYYLDPEVVTVANPAAAAAAASALPSSTPQGLSSAKHPAAVLEQPVVKLPPMLSESTRECHTCFEKERCLLLNAVYEGGHHALPPATFGPLTRHLTPLHIDYLRSWLTAIDSEQAAQEGVVATSANNQTAKSRLMDELEGARQRDEKGKCWSGLQVRSWRYAPADGDDADAPQHVLSTAAASTAQLLHGFQPTSTQLVLITFQRCAAAFPIITGSDSEGAAASHPPRSFLEYDMLEGDLLTLSSDPEALQMATAAAGPTRSDAASGAVAIYSRAHNGDGESGAGVGDSGDPCSASSLSSGGCLYGVASGVISHLDADSVTLKFQSVPRELKQACEESRRRIAVQYEQEEGEARQQQQQPQPQRAGATARALPSILWRLDRDDYSGIYRQMKHNVISLFFFGAPADPAPAAPSGAGVSGSRAAAPKPLVVSYGDERRRKLIVDRQEPRYSTRVLPAVSSTNLSARCCALLHGLRLPAASLPDSIHMANAHGVAATGLLSSDRQLLHYYHASLNSDQRSAVVRVLQQHDYTLVQGTPGSGKSTLITFLIHLLTALRQSVLLASYTHSAVDNILIKLLQGGQKDGNEHGSGTGEESAAANNNATVHAQPTLPPFRQFVRIGKRTQVHPKVHAHLLESASGHTASGDGDGSDPVSFRRSYSSVAELQRLAQSTPLVATTCLGISHPLLSAYRSQPSHSFDYCLLDECSQMSHPVSLGPLRFLGSRGSFILVGDHNQLPPLVKSPMARALHMHVSLFQSLSAAHSHSVVQLRTQYRMNAAIMDIANSLVYANALQCANEQVQHRKMSIPHVMRMRDVIGVATPQPATHTPTPSAAAQQSPSSSPQPSTPAPPPSLQLNLDWLAYIINPSVTVVFLDTSAMHAWDTRADEQQQQQQQQQQPSVADISAGVVASSSLPCSPPSISSIARVLDGGSSVRNPVEAALVLQIVHAFVSLGVSPDRIGVISPYKAQLTLLRTMLREINKQQTGTQGKEKGKEETNQGPVAATGAAAVSFSASSSSPFPSSSCSSSWSLVRSVESATVDRFQGRDKSLIVMSLVRSNGCGSVGQLLQDWRRINVAVTRARCKLILIGDSCTLKHAPLLAALLDYFAFRQQIYSLPPHAHLVYPAYRHVGRIAQEQQRQHKQRNQDSNCSNISDTGSGSGSTMGHVVA